MAVNTLPILVTELRCPLATKAPAANAAPNVTPSEYIAPIPHVMLVSADKHKCQFWSHQMPVLYSGLTQFCGIMNLPPPVNQGPYNTINKHGFEGKGEH